MFVPIAEEALGRHEIARIMAEEYLAKFKDSGIDTLILGCTHYPLLRDVIQETVGESVILVDSAIPTARLLKQELEKSDLLNEEEGSRKFCVTEAPERVHQIADVFLGKHIVPTLKKSHYINLFPCSRTWKQKVQDVLSPRRFFLDLEDLFLSPLVFRHHLRYQYNRNPTSFPKH
ncbi:MAG: aspartate/glutamate racemase family protein [Candidatus Blackburnbacteria bacterium]|nr:aspartate/glutamate racemase family protein [Candidatus Blackburnbacteria bacterium]